MSKWVPWILLGLSLVAACYLFLLLLNAGSALDDARSEVTRLRERSTLALAVLRKEWVGKDAASVSRPSRELGQKGVIVGTEGSSFEIGDLIFKTKDGLVTDIRYMD